MEVIIDANSNLKALCSTTIGKKFGLHQIKEAIEYYMANMTAGKPLLIPALTE